MSTYTMNHVCEAITLLRTTKKPHAVCEDRDGNVIVVQTDLEAGEMYDDKMQVLVAVR